MRYVCLSLVYDPDKDVSKKLNAPTLGKVCLGVGLNFSFTGYFVLFQLQKPGKQTAEFDFVVDDEYYRFNTLDLGSKVKRKRKSAQELKPLKVLTKLKINFLL